MLRLSFLISHFLFPTSVLAVAVWNWTQWQKDRALALRLRAERERLPPLENPGPAVPKVSVLVAAWNEAQMIARHIGSFLALRYPHKELILCAGGEDGTCALARELAGRAEARVVVLEQRAGEGKQGALRRCLEEARGEIIFLTDADCLLDDDSFERTLRPLLNEGEVAASGASQPLPEQRSQPFILHQWCTDLYAQAHMPEHITGLLGRNCAVRREALEAVGGFAADVATGTDYYLAKLLRRAGYAIRWVRESSVATRYPETFRSLWRRQSRWVRNLLLHGPGFGARDEVRAALTTGLAGWVMLGLPLLAAGAALLGRHSLAQWPLALWAVLWAHALLSRLRYADFGRVYRRVAFPTRQWVLTPFYIAVDFVAWARPVVDWAVGRRVW